jgi:hypothetical protein
MDRPPLWLALSRDVHHSRLPPPIYTATGRDRAASGGEGGTWRGRQRHKRSTSKMSRRSPPSAGLSLLASGKSGTRTRKAYRRALLERKSEGMCVCVLVPDVGVDRKT